jgi:hypothetical protein
LCFEISCFLQDDLIWFLKIQDCHVFSV